MGDNKHISQKVKSLYDVLKSNGEDVGSEQEFNDWFLKPGQEGYKNRKYLWDTFNQHGADVGANYEEFAGWLGLIPASQSATSPKAGQQTLVASGAKPLGGGVQSLIESGGVEPASAVSADTKAAPYGSPMAVNAWLSSLRGQAAHGARSFNERSANLLEHAKKDPLGRNAVKSGFKYNQKTGDFEQTYVTPYGTRHTNKAEADEVSRQWRDANDHSIEKQIGEAYREQERLEREIEARGKEIEQGESAVGRAIRRGVSGAIAGSLGGAVGKIVDYIANPSDYIYKRTDETYNQLVAASNANKERIKTLEAARDKGGFWRGAINTTTDPNTWLFGVPGLVDAATLYTTSKKLEKNGGDASKLTEAEKSMLDNVIANSNAQGEYGDELGFMYGAGAVTANALPFVAEFAVTGGFSGLANAGARIGEKLAAKAAAKGITGKASQWLIKNTGVAAGDIASSLAMANTTGAARTASNILDRHIGDATIDEQGNYTFKGGEDLATAAAKGVVSSTLEYYTEKLGGHLQLGKWLSKGAEKVGLSKLSKAINYASSNKWLEKGGVQDYPSEVLEEEANIVLNALLVGDNKFSDLWDAKTQADIWGGMAFSLGFMNAPKYANTGYQAAQYYRYKHKTDKSDAAASRQIGAEQWQELKEKIDGANNEHISDILNSEIIGNDDLNAESRKAAMDYAKNLLEMRGYNMGLLNSVKDDISDKEEDGNKVVDTAVGSSYTEGYNAADETEAATFEMEYEAARENAEQAFDEETLALLDDNPVYTLSALRSSEEFTDEALAIAVDYVNAKAARDGAEQRMADDLDSEIDAARGEVTQRINGDDFMIHGAQMKADNADGTPKRVHIISGNVTMREDGSVDTTNSSQTIVVRDAATGKVEMVSPEHIRSVDEAIDPQEEYSNAEAAARAAYEEKKARVQAAAEAEETEQPQTETPQAEIKGKEEQAEIQQVEDEQGNGQQIKPQTKIENLQTEMQAGAESPIVEQTEIPVEKDKKGNVVRTLYHRVPMQRTLEDLYDGSLDQEEIDRFVENLAADAKKRLTSVENEEKPQIGSNKRAYLEAKRLYEEKLADARAEVEYYDKLQKEVLRVTQRGGQQAGVAEDLGGEPLSLEELAARFASEHKVTPESMKGETGMSSKELKGFVGLVAKEENGGVSIERLGELLARSDEWAQLGGTPEMTQEARNMLIDAYMSGNPRSYVKQQRERFAQREAEHEMNEIENFAQAAFGMSAEEYLAYEEQALPAIINKYAGFDFDIYYAILQEQADARASEAEENYNNSINGNTYEQQGESNGNGGSGGILQTEGTADEQGERTSGEQEAGGQGSVGNAGLQGVGTQGNVGEDTPELVGEKYTGQVDPRTMSEEEKERRGNMLRNAPTTNVGKGIITSTAELSARRSAEKWWDENVGEPALYNTEVGEVEINRNSIESSLAHRYGQKKLDAITSLIEGFENAVYLGTLPDFNRQEGVNNHYFAYPIIYDGELNYVFCRAMQDANKNRLYVHEVFVGAKIKKGDTLQTAASQPHGGIALYRDILANVLEASAGKVTEKDNSVQTSIANAEAETETSPSEAQKKAGNYKKGHLKIGGFDVTIENPKGSVRSGVDADGEKWEQTMNNTYGYIRGTEGVDGDHIDVFLSDDPSQGDVFVVDQVNKDGAFDEHKVMYGFADEESARQAYLSNHEDGWTGLGAITRVSKEEFKKWVNSSHRKTKPFAKYKGVKKTEVPGETDNPGANEKTKSPAKKKVANSTRSAFDNLKKQASGRMLIFKEGGNYEILYEDAKKAAEILELPLQEKDGKTLVSFPIKDLDKNLPLLIREGVMVAITDELVNTKNQKAGKTEVPGETDNPGGDTGKKKGQKENAEASQESDQVSDQVSEQVSEQVGEHEFVPKYTVHQKPYTTKRGKVLDMQLLQFSNKLTKEQQLAAASLAREMKGWWSKEDNGFMMRSVKDAERIVNTIFDNEAVHDAQPLSVSDMTNATEQPQNNSVSNTLKNGGSASLGKHGTLVVGGAPAPKRVNVESLMGELNTKGVAKLSDHTEQVSNEEQQKQQKQEEEQPKSKWVNDEDADRFEELRKRLKEKMRGQMNMGVDPEIFAIGVEMSYLMLKRGARKFGEFAKNMIEALGDEIRPYIKAFYNGARDLPEMAEYESEMTPYEEVRSFDVEHFDKDGAKDILAMAQQFVKENKVEQEAKVATNKLKQQRNEQRKEEEKAGKSAKKKLSSQEQTPAGLFGGLFDDEKQKKSNNEQVHIQPRTGTSERDGGHQRGQNEPLGESKQHEDERTDNRGVVRRSGSNTMSDAGRGTSISELSNGEERVRETPRASERKNTNNNHAERGTDYAPKSVNARIEANIAAIETMQRLIESGQKATPDDMAVLRKFSGWGGLGAAFHEQIGGGAYGPENPVNKRLRELLSPEAYEAANMSRNSAYYTPASVIDAMWDVARAMGFRGGNVLEGSAGIGNIIGLMPTDMSERSNIHAIEIDETTGNILSLLYPDANVEVKGFEKTHVPNGSVDLAITNVPFVTGLRVMDETGDKDLSRKFRDIHDFCIAKNVRKLKEGGIGIFISSSGTLDSPNSAKLRTWLVNECGSDVVGAFRLNNQTFGGTGATSDIIVVRKRVNGSKSANAIDVSGTLPIRTVKYDSGETKRGSSEVIIKDLVLDANKHFVEHPEDMAGEMAFAFEKGDNYRATSKALYPSPNINQEQRLTEWAKRFAGMNWDKAEERQSQQVVYEDLGEGVKEGSMLLDGDGNICLAQRGKAVPLGVNSNKVKGHTKAECFAAYKAIKDALSDVLEYQTTNSSDIGLKQRLDALNKAYDHFVNTYGHLNKNTSISFLRNDIDYPSIAALESFSETGDKSGKRIVTYGKTDIFSRRVVDTDSDPKPKNLKDGIIASIYLNGRVDIPYIAEQLEMPVNDVRRQIVESGLGFENPTTTEIEVSYEYLSGNVREKLRQAKENNTDGRYDSNIKALERVVPMNIPAHLIEFTLGSSWVEPKLYEDYVKERTGLDVKLTSVGGTWLMSEPYWTNSEQNKAMGVISELCGKTILGHELINAAITCRSISVTKTVSTGYKTTETIVDKEATIACANKIDEIRQDFKDWARGKMQSDPEMSERIERTYNDLFNNSVPIEIPDDFVPEHFGGAATIVNGKEFKLRPHQAKATIRGTMQPLMLAHEVGTGKTYTLISTAMEMRRIGTARKPMIVVQNATVGQFVSSAKALYPNAKILTLEDADRNEEGRRNFYAKIKYNDWDMIVVPQSVFELIPDSEERQMRFVEDKIEETMAVLEKMREEADRSDPALRRAERELSKLNDELNDLKLALSERKGNSGKDEKRKAKTKQNAMVKAQEMLDRKTDDVENFDDMGIDALLIDEAHEYKHLGFATAMQRGVKGVDPSYSKKSQGVYLKTQAVLEKNNGKNVVFATGTPISNTAAEIWTFMRYLMPADMMRDYGIYYFDDFVRNFGNVQQMLEFGPNGKYKENNRFAGYVNLPELVRIWESVTDTVLTREAGGVSDKIPEMEGGKAQDIYLPQTKALRSVMLYVKSQLDAYEKMSGKEKKENSHIPLVMYGIAKSAAVDARLVLEDAADEPNSKTNEAVRQTLRSLEDTKVYNGTVAIFADNYQNKATGFNLYEDIRKKLIAAGIPEGQVVVMKPGMTIKKKLEIFDKVNRGDVRVIMGSTFTLGTGVNIQERLHTLIHVDAPNRPMDYTQRNGRILRQGNLHKEWGVPVRVLRFGVEDSLDVTAYQRLKTKGAIADSIMEGKKMIDNSMENRVLEEEQDIFGDITAQLSGSQYALLKNQVEKEVRKLEARKKQYDADQTYVHNQKPRLSGLIKNAETKVEKYRYALTKVEGAIVDGIEIGGKKFASIDAMSDYIKEYNSKQRERQEQVRNSPSYSAEATSELTATIGGFEFKIQSVVSKEQRREAGSQSLLFSAKTRMTYSCRELGLENVPVDGQRLKSALEDIVENVMSGNDFREQISANEAAVERYKNELKQVSEREGKPFEYADALEQAMEKLAEYEELMKEELAEKEAKYAEIDAGVDEAKGVKSIEEEDEDNLYRDEDVRDRIETLFNQAVSGKFTGKPVSVGRLTENGRAYLENISGIAFKENVDFVLNPSDLKHIYKDHFGINEKDAGSNVPLDIDDIRSLYDVISNPDKIAFFKEESGNNRNMFYFFKEADDGTYNLMEIYSDRKGNLTAKTFYKTRKDAAQRVVDIEKSLLLTSETYSGAILSNAKIPQMFDAANTEEDFSARDGNGAYTSDEVSMENDPWSKMAGYNIRSKKERMAFAERERRRMVAAVTELAERLGIADDVEIVTDLSGLQGRQRRAKGIYRKSTGKITIYIPNHVNVADAVATFLHEAVAHKGLRNLFGEHFDEFLDKVYANSNSEIRSAVDALAKKKKLSTRTATEEYLAGLAESTDFEHLPYDGWWQRVKEFFIDMLHKVGIKALDMTTLTDNELRYILWRSYRYMTGKDKGIIAFVEDTAMKMKLGVGYSEKEGASGAAEVAGKTEASAKNKKNSARSVFDNMKKQQAFDKLFLFKVGDNYEILYEDAKGASEILGLPLQEKDGKEFVSFPVKDLDKNLALLVRGGAYVAVDNNPVQELFRDGATEVRGENSEEELFRDGEEEVPDDTENADETDGGSQSDTKQLRDILIYGNLSFAERTTAAMLLYSNLQHWDKKRKADAMRAIGDNLSEIAKAMRLQRDFDKATVKRVHDLARVLMESGYLSDLKEQEVKRLLAAVKNSVGKNDIDASVQKVMDIMIDNMLRRGKAALSAIESVRGSKTDTRGVEVQGMLGVDGQTIVKAFKEAKKIVNPCAGKTEGENGENTAWGAAFESVYSRMDSKDQAVADEASLEYAGMQMAQQWYEEIAKSKLEEEAIRLELKEEHDKKSAEERRTDSYREFAASMEEAIRQNKIERAQAYFNLAGRLSDSLRGSVENALAFKEAEKKRIGEIHHAANSDMQGRSAKEHQMPDSTRKALNNLLGNSLFAPLATYMEMLRLFGAKSVNGEGYLFNLFGRGWIDARQKEIRGVRGKLEMLDAKAKEVFGGKVETWGDLIRAVGKLPKGKVSFYNGGEMQEMELPQGNLMYIYMANKMLDGKMKLRKMGISEEDVSRLEEFLDPRLKEIADWLQEEFLVKTRNEYNKTHKRMFGASMAAVENYFPLRILNNALDVKADELDQPKVTDGISTITGSIIKRRRNSKPLDILNADALHVILGHVAQMEHWNAYAEFNRDLNTLRSYRRFRNQVQNMETIYGNSKNLWNKFNDVCQMAAGVYKPKGDEAEKAALAVAQGVTAAAVSFRLYTALKQFASLPAYIPYTRADYLTKAMMRPDKSWEWCMENLPIFEERWKSRVSGDPRLVKSFLTAADWRRNLAANCARAGMAPNAFIDALTCSIGAYAVYNTRKKQYLKDGYSEEQAERKAIQDAEMVYNETQQSGEDAFTSTMQRDRTWWKSLFTIFRNASMSYQRQLHGALRDLGNVMSGGVDERVAFVTKQLLREKGIQPNENGEWSEADYKREEAIAKRKVRRQFVKDGLSVATFGYIMQLAWNISGYLPYLLFGDDDETKDEFWDDIWTHTFGGWLEGFTGGDVMSLAIGMLLNGEYDSWKLKKEMPVTSATYDAIGHLLKGDFGAFATNATNLLIQVSAGVNPQSLTDGALAIMDACGGDPALANEAVICVSRILSVPQSQIDKMYFDEVGLRGDEVSKYTPAQLAERYALYKVKRGRFFAPWSWDDEELIEKQEEKANTAIKERLGHAEFTEVTEAYERYEKIAKEIGEQVNALKKAEGDGSIKQDEGKKRMDAIKQDRNFNTYALFTNLDKPLEDMSKRYMAAKSPEEAAMYAEAVGRYRLAMLDALSADNYAELIEAISRAREINVRTQEERRNKYKK